MKKIFLLLICLLFCSGVSAEKIDEVWHYNHDKEHKEFNEQNFPLMYNYFKDYAQEIFWKFDITKYPRPGFVEVEVFYIYKDGRIEYTWNPAGYDFKKNTISFRKFLNENPPPPFPKGMEDEKIWVRLVIANDKDYFGDLIGIYVYNHPPANGNTMNLSLDKNQSHMHMTKRKCKRQGYNWNEDKNYCEISYKFKLGLH